MDDLRNAIALYAAVVEHLGKVSRAHDYAIGVKISRTCEHFVAAMENDLLGGPYARQADLLSGNFAVDPVDHSNNS